MIVNGSIPVSADSPEARRYNRIRRWLGIADFVLGFLFLVGLLVTGWSGWLRDLAYRLRALINPQATGLKAGWVYDYDAATAEPEAAG